jgi:hypothetical protein
LRQASNEGEALTFNQIVGHMATAAVQPLPRHNNFRGHEPGGDFLLVPRSFSGTVAANVARTPNEPPRDVRGPERREPTNTTARSTTPAVQALVLVGAEYNDAQARGGESALALDLIRGRISQAFRSKGVEAVSGHSLSAADQKRCDSAACIEVKAIVTRAISGPRHTINVTLSARSRGTSRDLGSASDRDGPRLLEVPADRMVERAVDKALASFVDAVVAALANAR